MSEWCVCSASHGHPPGFAQPLGEQQQPHDLGGRARRTGVDLDEERGEVIGHDGRGRARRARPSLDALVGQSPSRWSTVTGVSGSRCSSSASFTSESTSALSHCATSIGPASSTVVDRAARRRRAPRRAIGSTPTRAHASSANDNPGTTSNAMPARRVQQRDRALGDRRAAGHRVHDVVVRARRRPACRPCARTPSRGRARRRRRRRTT